ncbi:tail assembly chaperone [Mycobacterium phage JoieB]|uniref:Tail assembly chaperone n=1 Tax=Mycobacterium phage JoieB TaxID=2653277 RepID=A0A5P8D531_9CAUD|nr:tail assembly chaperone [Mycobacterium phage JoieB]
MTTATSAKKAKGEDPVALRLTPSRDYTNEQIVSAATGRWGEVAHEIKPAEPYVIDKPDGSQIVVTPLTRRRRKAMKAAQAAYMLIAAQLADVQREGTADNGIISRIETQMEEAERAYDVALFGDVCDEVYEFFEDLQEEFWDAMYSDIHNALVNRVELPEDICSKCGQKVEDAAGKRGILLDIIDRYWDAIEGDFQAILHADAGEWFRCRLFGEDTSRYSWDKFLRNAVYCTNEHGSALFDATLGDQDVIDELYEKAVAEQSSKRKKPDSEDEYQPSRRGYTRQVEATLDVVDNLIALRAEMGKWKASSTRFSPRPVFPAQAVQDRLRKRNRAIRDDRIAKAQERWRKKRDGTTTG